MQLMPQHQEELIQGLEDKKNSRFSIMNKSSNALLVVNQRKNSKERTKVNRPTQTKNCNSSSFSSAQFGNQVLQNTLMSAIDKGKDSIVKLQRNKVLSQNYITAISPQKEQKKSELNSLPLSGVTTPTSRLLTPEDGKIIKNKLESVHNPVSSALICRTKGTGGGVGILMSNSKITSENSNKFNPKQRMNMFTPNSTIEQTTTKPATPLFTNAIPAIKHRSNFKRKQILNFSEGSKQEFSPSPESIANQLLKHVYSQESKHGQIRCSSQYNRRPGFHPTSTSPGGGMQNAFTIKSSKIKTVLVPKKEVPASSFIAPSNNRLTNYLSFKRQMSGQQLQDRETSHFGWNNNNNSSWISKNDQFLIGTPSRKQGAIRHMRTNFKSLLPSRCGQFSLKLNF